jgi:hypothetical protein
VARHLDTLAVNNIVDSRLQTGFVPEMSRTPVIGPEAPSLRNPACGPKGAGAIRLEIGEHAFRLSFSTDHRVNMGGADVYGMGLPAAMPADRENYFEREEPGFPVENPR